MANGNVSAEEKKYLKKLGIRIRGLRTEKGWTLEDVEEHGWNNWQHLQKIEAGKNITIVTLRRVAQLYRISAADLLKDV